LPTSCVSFNGLGARLADRLGPVEEGENNRGLEAQSVTAHFATTATAARLTVDVGTHVPETTVTQANPETDGARLRGPRLTIRASAPQES
jgi:hypothetical protein